MTNQITNSSKLDKAGDMEMDIGGKRYALRLTFQACRLVERSLDISFQKLSQRMADMDFRFEDMATVFHAAIVGAGIATKDAPSVSAIGEVLLATPIETYMVEYGNLIAGVVTAGRAKRLTKEDTDSGEATTQTTSGADTGPLPSASSESSLKQLGG